VFDSDVVASVCAWLPGSVRLRIHGEQELSAEALTRKPEEQSSWNHGSREWSVGCRCEVCETCVSSVIIIRSCGWSAIAFNGAAATPVGFVNDDTWKAVAAECVC
jgi:hypothetical protein